MLDQTGLLVVDGQRANMEPRAMQMKAVFTMTGMRDGTTLIQAEDAHYQP